ncbi:hypothetical protein K493DRAFT_348538 [Basidiobolus meristosporus CBS 931.73]|uniref:Uncharacterized protein n=1 Tax=Basidiobolus meristosporus CBS 931.73 TaxID=1314790 RepID=A0A1Y1YNF1_9FUNG|nr:hypothetical protein K493DRAFT_364286 [Basidiobolus meristosporus CBS 931.73]ORX99532.1 hypothetical protein K493DRAFT_348538 [Basidiobolus meristosporus CBS 931.73]|eukprot:ORX73419.1 hypothetical protein K493DRAFT_364286 [Basidiobolus meristosporus CBS 931.73]
MKAFLPLSLLSALSLVQAAQFRLANDFPDWNIGTVTSFESDIEVIQGGDASPGMWTGVNFDAGYFSLYADSSSHRSLVFTLFDRGQSGKTEISAISRDAVSQNATEQPGSKVTMNLDWKTGESYRMRLDVQPSGPDAVFTAQIRVNDEWRFLANVTGKNFGSYSLRSGLSQLVDNLGSENEEFRTAVVEMQNAMAPA